MIDTTPFKHLYPFASNWLHLDGLRYHYLDEGAPDAPVMLMLHGNPTWSFYYRTLIPHFSRTHRVIVPDHIGCGLSDKPQAYRYTLDQHISNVERLVEQLTLKEITLVLHDWGGPIGLGYAARHPANVTHFVIFNTTASAAPLQKIPKRIKICRIPIFGEVLVRGVNGFCLVGLKAGTSQPDRFTSGVRAGYLAPYNSWANRIAVHRFVQDIPLEAHHATLQVAREIEAGLPHFKNHPILIIWGDDDFCFTTRDFLSDFQARFPQAEVHILPQAGHYVVEDAHERIIPLMDAFLT
ncbi:MAG: alpha/beta fold hydrolase [Anaerolineae bacterium]|nr:alpha/beta fold hydrolase [Anaerolineae bacterium]